MIARFCRSSSIARRARPRLTQVNPEETTRMTRVLKSVSLWRTLRRKRPLARHPTATIRRSPRRRRCNSEFRITAGDGSTAPQPSATRPTEAGKIREPGERGHVGIAVEAGDAVEGQGASGPDRAYAGADCALREPSSADGAVPGGARDR